MIIHVIHRNIRQKVISLFRESCVSFYVVFQNYIQAYLDIYVIDVCICMRVYIYVSVCMVIYYLFTWLCWLLVAAHGIFGCGIWDLVR